jgi:hypothetical protein
MPNDAKLGLIAGVAVVLVIAALFFRKEAAPVQAGTESAAVSASAGAETKSVPAPPAADADLPPLPPPPLEEP